MNFANGVFSFSRPRLIVSALALALTSAAQAQPAPTQTPDGRGTVVKIFEFGKELNGVLPGFADYGPDAGGYDFQASVRELPKDVELASKNRKAYYLESDNHADDMFMYLKAPLKKADGVVLKQKYRMSFEIDLASNSTNCIGVGGSEDAVMLYAGGSTVEPVSILEGDTVRISVDKGTGEGDRAGQNLGSAGSIWNGQECTTNPEERRWVMLHKSYTHPYPIESSQLGEIWIAVGTDSGYEAVTGVYIHSIKVKLTPVK